MEFNFETKKNGEELDIILSGNLDANSATPLLEEMKKYIGEKISKITFHAAELNYIASAGLRVIIFTKQKIGYEADVFLKNPNEVVRSVVDMTGLDNFIQIIE